VTPKPTPRQLLRILCILHALCGSSTKCHVPPEAIAHRLPREARGTVAKALRRLTAKGLVWEKPHGPGRKSYGLTRKGVRTAEQLCGSESQS